MLGHGVGPIPTRVMIVGEAWGRDEEAAGEPFVGVSGQELNRMLHEAGILRSECFVTNVVNARPANNDLSNWIAPTKKAVTSGHVSLRDKMVLPIVCEGYKRLLREIDAVQPNIIIAFGNLAMWALTGEWAITKWRGSTLKLNLYTHVSYKIAGSISSPELDKALEQSMKPLSLPPIVIPCIHPAAILREWSWRQITISDLRRAKKHIGSRELSPPPWNFLTQPSFSQVQETLEWLLTSLQTGEVSWLDFDLETRLGHISCVGISWTKTDAICIPFMSGGRKEGYWNLEQEAWIVWMVQRVCTHPNAKIRWQNGLYDAQYTYRHWHFVPRGHQDTMISQHALFSDLPKSLAFIGSMYCDYYVYWKDEGKDFNTGGRDEKKGWIYNCEDCVYTREGGEVLQQTAAAMGLSPVDRLQNAIFYPALYAMLKGVRVVENNSGQLAEEIQEQISIREAFLFRVLGHGVNYRSSKQMQALFYDDLRQPPIMSRAKKGKPAHITCDDEALQKIAAREPLMKPLVNAIADCRTLNKFLGDVILSKRDIDGRIRCSYNIGGSASGKSAPKTYRMSSSKSAFDSGLNLQNIPSEKSKSVGKAKARGHIEMFGDPYAFPNLRSIFGPDSGKMFFDVDLDRADLQVMAWDADEPLLKEALRRNVDVHLLNVFILDNKDPPPLDELVETHPKYPDHRGPRKHQREFAKVFCHATDYLGKARTVAAATGRTVHETERAQGVYLGTYKGIKEWQDSIIEQVRKRRFVENKFGYRYYIFDRIDDQVMPEAVAWIPQSTVSIVINKIWMSLYQDAPEAEWNLDPNYLWSLLERPREIEVLLQVHDSLGGQFPRHRKERNIARIRELSAITVPYDDPLVIPVGIGTSELSWGDCE